EEDEVGGLAGDVGAAHAHGHADVGRAQGRPVVDAVPGHRDDVTAAAQRSGDAQLVLRCDAADDHAVAVEQLAEGGVVGRELGTGDDAAAVPPQADLAGDRLPGG